jgi:hypothetical protein
MADSALAKALGKAKDQAAELFSLIYDEEKARTKRWEDEKPAITVSKRWSPAAYLHGAKAADSQRDHELMAHAPPE